MNEVEKEVLLIVETLGDLDNGFKLKTSQARYIVNCLKTMASNMGHLASMKEVQHDILHS